MHVSSESVTLMNAHIAFWHVTPFGLTLSSNDSVQPTASIIRAEERVEEPFIHLILRQSAVTLPRWPTRIKSVLIHRNTVKYLPPPVLLII